MAKPALQRCSQAWFRSAARCLRRTVRLTAKPFGPAPVPAARRGSAKPSWQHDPDCTSRTVADVSAVAQNVAVYDSYGYGGWTTAHGTILSVAVNAGVFGLAGNARSQNAAENFWTLSKKKRNKEMHYISSGNDGSCGGEYLCQAGTETVRDLLRAGRLGNAGRHQGVLERPHRCRRGCLVHGPALN